MLNISELYMLGSGCDTAWDLSMMVPFEKVGDVWVWEGSLISGELAITPQTISLTPRLSYIEDGKLAYDQTSLTDITIDQDGTYKIVVDARDCDNITYELIKNE